LALYKKTQYPPPHVSLVTGVGECPWWRTLVCRGRNAVADFPCSY